MAMMPTNFLENHMSFSHLKDLVPKSAGKFHLQGELYASFIIHRSSSILKEFLSEEVLQLIQVKKFTNGVLWLAVTHPIASYEIQQKSYLILKKLNIDLEEGRKVRQIRSFQEAQEPEEEH